MIKRKLSAYTAIANRAITNRGTFASEGEMAMKLVQTVYSVGFVPLGIVRTSSTIKNLPNPPSGERTAAIRLPTLLSGPSPASQEGTTYAPAARTAPRAWTGACQGGYKVFFPGTLEGINIRYQKESRHTRTSLFSTCTWPNQARGIRH